MFALNREKYASKIPPSRYELDSKHKMIVDLSHKLDAQHRKVKTIVQLYSKNLIELRKQIFEEISLVFRYAPIEYGRQCEDILWKRNYYDCVKVFRTLPSNELEKNSHLFRFLLISGIGHYHSLILSFRKNFHLSNLDDLIFLPNNSDKLSNNVLTDLFNFQTGEKLSKENEDEAETIGRFDFEIDAEDDINVDFDVDYTYDPRFMETILYLVERFFICLGDLARYYLDLLSQKSEMKFDDHFFNMALFYYKSASIVQPQLGAPYNQLGTLFSNSSFYGLDSLYYYFRSLNSKKPFVSIKENLRQTFDFVRHQHYNKLDSSKKRRGSLYSNGLNNSITKQVFNNDSDLVRSTILRLINFFSQIFKLIDEVESDYQQVLVEELVGDLNETLILFRNAINIESKSKSRVKPDSLGVENIFQIVAIIMILIDQISMILKKHSMEVDLSIAHSLLESKNLSGDIRTRGNFILYISYQFLFQLISIIIHRESGVLKKILYQSQNIMDDSPHQFKIKSSDRVKIKSDAQVKNFQYSRSFSSDFGEPLDEAMSQLKNTAFQTIQDILDSSENEDEDNIVFGDLNDREFSVNEHQLNDKNDYLSPPDSKTFDQILVQIYSESSMPIIKFFCDYLQSNSDFMDILQNMDVLLEFFENLFQYLNIISQFDLKLLMNFKFYLEKQFHSSQTSKEKLHQLVDLFNFINKWSLNSVKDFKQKYPLSSEMEFMNLTNDLKQFYQQLFDCPDEMSLMSLKCELSVEKSSYISIHCLLIFGIKLALLSLDTSSFKLSLLNFNLMTVHNIKDGLNVSFVFELLKPIESSIIKDDRYAVCNKTESNQLISFDSNDKEVENACLDHQTDDNGRPVIVQNQNSGIEMENRSTPNQSSSKKLYDLERLPYILIDPYVYLENLEQIKQIVLEKKAFLIVPKSVTDFLNYLKEKQVDSATEAADFLHEEFFRGSRMIRFIRKEDRLELEMLNYPRNKVWNYENDLQNDFNINALDKARQEQDLILFYELLEHCHYLLVNKVLVNRIPVIRSTCKDTPNVHITLITNNLSKWPSNASSTIAQTCGIDIETFDSYYVKLNNRQQNKKIIGKFNKRFNRYPSHARSPQHDPKTSSTHFKPIQFLANNSEMSSHT